MHKVFQVSAGIDAHTKVLYVCLLNVALEGRLSREVRTFDTTTRDLLSLLDWRLAE